MFFISTNSLQSNNRFFALGGRIIEDYGILKRKCVGYVDVVNKEGREEKKEATVFFS